MFRLHRKIRDGEPIEDFLKEAATKCWIRPDGRIIYGNTNLLFSNIVWNVSNPDNLIIFGSSFYILHKDGNLQNEEISNLEKINIYERKEDFLDEMKKICRIRKGRRLYGHGKKPFAHLIYNRNNTIVKGDGYAIHHKNFKKLDDSITNLQKLIKSEHRIVHNIGNKYGVGHHPSSSKIVMVEYHIFSSILQASNCLGMIRKTIREILNNNEPGYFYINKKEKRFK